MKHTPGTLRVCPRQIAEEALEAAQTAAFVSDSPALSTVILAGALSAIAAGRPYVAPLVFGDARKPEPAP